MTESSNKATVISASYRNHLAFGMFVRNTSDSEFDMDSITHSRGLWVDDFLFFYINVLKKIHDTDGFISQMGISAENLNVKRDTNGTT